MNYFNPLMIFHDCRKEPSMIFNLSAQKECVDKRSRSIKSPLLLLYFFVMLFSTASLFAQNPIVQENLLPGNPASEWDIGGNAGDLTIQGFATDISVNKGKTVEFKIKTDAAAYTINIYRLGYYAGKGARKVGSLNVTTPQTQPNPITDLSTGLVDCGNWAVSAQWTVPANAVSGIYIAKLIRADNGGASHITFIVRDDKSTSDLYFQTSVTTWQAYNVYGGNSLYVGNTSFPNGHATKVSFNRPFYTRTGAGGGGPAYDWLFNAEYPMLRWLERNGYDMSYTTDLDVDRFGSLIKNHQVFLSVGHDEYWSAQQRANVEAALNDGTHLAFFSGNEIYWKIRWEPSIDGSNTPYRTLVCYKEGTLGEYSCGYKCDPKANVWTGLWRDGCGSPAADGCRPENALSGQISWNQATAAITVPATFKSFRFWRNTSIASLGAGQVATLTDGTLGHEIDVDQNNGSYPPGRVGWSETKINNFIHRLSIYRSASGALVFGAGTIQWSWGLDGTHDRGPSTEDIRMQQATVNVLADMGAQPGSIQKGASALVQATMITDKKPPVTVITFPKNGSSVTLNGVITITGTATEDAGVVAGVEVSTDGGVSWQPAIGITNTGTTNWSYAWTPSATGNYTIKSRAVDDMGNLESATTTSNTVNISVNPASTAPGITCPGTITKNNDLAKCTASVIFAATATGSPVPSITYKIGNQVITSPYSFPVGSSTVTAIASNGTAPNATCSFVVTVTDATKPTVNPPANITVNSNAGGVYTIPPVTATDNCGIQSYAYAITGDTRRSGSGSNASGTFNIGTSTITWTVTDINGNVSTATTTVIVSNAALLVVSIPDASAYSTGVDPNTVYKGYDPASSITLTAHVGGGTAPYSYKWSNGATSKSIKVSPNSKTTYVVKVTDDAGKSQLAYTTIYSVDVSCGNGNNYYNGNWFWQIFGNYNNDDDDHDDGDDGNDKVEVCISKGRYDNNPKTYCKDVNSVDNLLEKGADLGACKLNSFLSSDKTTAVESLSAIDNFGNPSEEEMRAGLKVKVLPNPSSSHFTIKIQGNNSLDKISLRVLDLYGKTVESKTVNASQVLELGSSYIPGIYIVEILQSGKKVITKLVKQ